MKLFYNVTGTARKSLTEAMSQTLNAPTRYLGAPTFAFEVGGYNIDKNGTVTGADDYDLEARLWQQGFTTVEREYDGGVIENGNVPEAEDTEAEDVSAESMNTDTFTIEIPLTGFTPEKLGNLTRLVTAKAALLKAALDSADLPIQRTDNTLRFPWFKPDITGDEITAYTALISLLCKTAKDKKRVTSKEKDIDGSPKYAMRCFLLSIGMIGTEYKAARKILLSKLEGNSSWKNVKKADEVTETGTTDSGLAETGSADAESIDEIFPNAYTPPENTGVLSCPDDGSGFDDEADNDEADSESEGDR